jgi:uncharacterized protein (DUF58 family)
MMSRYAASTAVSSEKTRAEIERTLTKYGATGFMYGWQGPMAMIAFELQRRRIRFLLPLPDRNDNQFRFTPARGLERSPEQIAEAYDQAVRQRWRALLLVIKAKLEAVEAGITTLESEFLSNLLLPNQQTVGEWLEPQLEEVYQSGTMPPLLPAPGGGR